ncbi:MAG: pyridoxal phosphate-dependent aminotransferase [Acidobacteriota bacterium]|nr:pyridoxal phosphate-dependent aminotransferase [Acidobacteriota bacterium]MDE3223606.1 pyridoxal phosphate-dependent aminotransferase [Acidobacteriota bacterium]
MRSRVSDLLLGLAPSATLAVDAKAKALKAAGEPVIGYGAGEPDFPTPPHIVEAAAAACLDPKNHKYTPTAGLPELREAIVAKTKRDSGLEIAPNQVLVTNGGKHAVATTFMTVLNPGDEVLIPAPYWTTYPEAVYLAGGVPVPVMTSEANGFRVTVDELEAARTEKTKLLVFVSPSNPSGAVVAPDEVAAIGRWAAAHDIWVMTDEIYEHLVYGDAKHVSMPVVAPELGDRWIVVNGVAKTYAMTGWRIGWMIGAPDVMDAAVNYQSQTTSNIANVSQRAAVAALTGDLSAVAEMRAAFDRRRQKMVAMLNAIDGVTCAMPEGAFYAYPNVTGLLGRSLGGRVSTSSSELAANLLETIKIAVVPGEAFGTPGFFRLSYALGDDDLVEGLERLAKFVAQG